MTLIFSIIIINNFLLCANNYIMTKECTPSSGRCMNGHAGRPRPGSPGFTRDCNMNGVMKPI